jgi:hypothetical protein
LEANPLLFKAAKSQTVPTAENNCAPLPKSTLLCPKEKQMPLKMFFADYCEDKVLESNDARVASTEEILHSMDCVLHMPRNFIGVTDENKVTLQFMVNDDKTICVDVPAPSEQGSYVKTASLGECLKIVGGLGEQITVKEIEGLEFQAW